MNRFNESESGSDEADFNNRTIGPGNESLGDTTLAQPQAMAEYDEEGDDDDEEDEGTATELAIMAIDSYEEAGRLFAESGDKAVVVGEDGAQKLVEIKPDDMRRSLGHFLLHPIVNPEGYVVDNTVSFPLWWNEGYSLNVLYLLANSRQVPMRSQSMYGR